MDQNLVEALVLNIQQHLNFIKYKLGNAWEISIENNNLKIYRTLYNSCAHAVFYLPCEHLIHSNFEERFTKWWNDIVFELQAYKIME